MEAALPPVLASIKALDRTEEPASPPAAPQHYDVAEPPLLDTWELDEQLRHAARLLGLNTGDGTALARMRSDSAQPAAPGWHRAEPHRRPRLKRARPDRSQRLLGLLGAAATWLGTAALSCGGILLAWAEISVRPELQTVGLPIAAGGAIGLTLGLVFRSGRGRHEPRFAAPPVARRIDLKSTTHGDRPHPRRPAGQHAERAA
jgi:hypothetical protein